MQNIIPTTETGDWRFRECDRFFTGAYKSATALAHLPVIEDHFLHVAVKRHDCIAYTKNADKGARDLQSIMSVSAYLTKYHPALTVAECKEIAAAHCTFSIATELQFAKTEDEIESVYADYDKSVDALSASCMRHGASNWRGNYHPCRVYAAGDLAIAYLANDHNETIARALVWPAKKLYSRAYARDSRLVELLRMAGYTPCRYYGKENPTMAGARLLARFVDHKHAVMPYIDGSGNNAALRDGFIYLAGSGAIDCSQIDGFSYCPNSGPYIKGAELGRDDEPDYDYHCTHCNEGYYNSDESYTVYTSRRCAQQWCDSCMENDAFFCDASDNYYSDAVESIQMANGETWSEYAYGANGGQCEHSDGHYPSDELRDVRVGNMRTEQWCDAVISKHAWTCDITDEICSIEHCAPITILDVYGNPLEQAWAGADFAEHGIIRCAATGEYIHADVAVMIDGEHVGAWVPQGVKLPYYSDSPDQLALALAA